MQTRPYPERSGRRIWLSRREQEQLLGVYRDEDPQRYLALALGLSGLRTDEIIGSEDRGVAREHFRTIETDESPQRYKLIIPDGKTGRRETPVSTDVRQVATILSNAAGLRKDDPLVDVSKRTVRSWIREAREQLANRTGDDRWLDVTMHDLRRTWATDSFYSLAFAGVPIAEELTMGWGGWAMTESGRSTFRENYLGPEPDHIAVRAMEQLPME